jgi:hypothetical protein
MQRRMCTLNESDPDYEYFLLLYRCHLDSIYTYEEVNSTWNGERWCNYFQRMFLYSSYAVLYYYTWRLPECLLQISWPHYACSDSWHSQQASSLYTLTFLFNITSVNVCILCLLTVIPSSCYNIGHPKLLLQYWTFSYVLLLLVLKSHMRITNWK